MASDPCIVQAIFSFKGTNNDELRFKKGDKITITQKEEGGWWEGTLGDKTGWFPNNYVKEIKDVTLSPISPVSQQRQYRAVVLNDLIDSERAHVTELQGLVKTFLKPLEKSNILTTDEYKQLIGNINEVLDTHQKLLELLEESEKIASAEQRVGKLFLTWAPKIKGVHQAYCSTHPRAVCVLDLHKDELASYMESCGAATPGLLVLTTGLSKPFRRLDKYSGMLQELERHVEINHPDRGDIQRSVAVYKDIAATCAATRRQKELELQVLTGPVRGWEGQSLAQLGDIIHMGSVAVGPQHQDRYLVLFPNNLLVLSVSQRMSAFIYEGKLPLTGITINRLDDTESCKNAFEVSGPMIEKIIAICQSKEEANNWVDLLRQHTKGHQKSPPPITLGETAPTPPPHMSPLATTPIVNRPSQSTSTASSSRSNRTGWSVTCLRPSPPIRPCLALGSASNNSLSSIRSSNQRKTLTHHDDAQILKVIEAYCSSSRPQNTISTAVTTTPDRKQSSPSSSGDNFKTLQTEVRNLHRSVSILMVQLTEEKLARNALQNIVRQYLVTHKDADSINWPQIDL